MKRNDFNQSIELHFDDKKLKEDSIITSENNSTIYTIENKNISSPVTLLEGVSI